MTSHSTLDGFVTHLSNFNRVALVGVAGSGKDHIASLTDKARYAFADPLRQTCRWLYPGIEEYDSDSLKDTMIPKYNMTARQMWIKTSEAVRSINDTLWIDKTLENIGHGESPNIIITDCRTSKELNTLRSIGFRFFWIENPSNAKTPNSYDTQNTLTLKSLCDETYINLLTHQ